MTTTIPFFDGHNDFLLRLAMAQDQREALWLGDTGKGHLDLARMKRAGFAGGLFAIFVPPQPEDRTANFATLLANPPYDVALPPLMKHPQAQPAALQMGQPGTQLRVRGKARLQRGAHVGLQLAVDIGDEHAVVGEAAIDRFGHDTHDFLPYRPPAPRRDRQVSTAPRRGAT